MTENTEQKGSEQNKTFITPQEVSENITEEIVDTLKDKHHKSLKKRSSVADRAAPRISYASFENADLNVKTDHLSAKRKSADIKTKIKQADLHANNTIANAVQKGSNTLNATRTGQAYLKASEKVSEKIASTKTAKLVNSTKKAIESAVTSNTVVKQTSKAVTKVAMKTGLKAGGKSLLKKIPIISAGAGLYFAYDRIKDKDYIGACGEVVSGVAGCLPGLGTAVSAAIDVGLGTKDVVQAVKETKQTKSFEDSAVQTVSEKKAKPHQPQKNQKQTSRATFMSQLMTIQEKQDSTAVYQPKIQLPVQLENQPTKKHEGTRISFMQKLAATNNKISKNELQSQMPGLQNLAIQQRLKTSGR